ncbi:GNAT family N-acetyltransferase [Rhizobium sp. NPDC090275]|uniref:GNAT family N-acetyltransferase n=1 Tax=Rhizobium sp. NPDC090275 TaxID=3364498 RepID=UPI00383B28F3
MSLIPTGTIREITYAEGVCVRSDVLKPSPAKVVASIAQYQDNSAIHFGADVGGKLIAVASFTPFAEDGSRDLTSYQLRGAATRTDFQGKGIGRTLIATGIEACFQRGAALVWCDGRSAAKTFYERLGFMSLGPEFDTSSGPHYRFRRSS